MKRQGLTDGNGAVATAAGANGYFSPRVRRVTVLPSNACVQETADGVDAVVTIKGRGRFLVRGRNGDHPHGRCPLLRYDIRRIDQDIPGQGDPPRATPWIGSASERTGRQAATTDTVADAIPYPHRHPHRGDSEEARHSGNQSLVHAGEAETGHGKQRRRGSS